MSTTMLKGSVTLSFPYQNKIVLGQQFCLLPLEALINEQTVKVFPRMVSAPWWWHPKQHLCVIHRTRRENPKEPLSTTIKMAHMPSPTSPTRPDATWLGSPTGGTPSRSLPTASGPHRRVMPASAWPQVSAGPGQECWVCKQKAMLCHMIAVWSWQVALPLWASVRLTLMIFFENI